MPYTPIPDLPQAPQRTMEPTEFANVADAWVADLQRWTDDTNDAGAYIDGVGAQVDATAAQVTADAQNVALLAQQVEQSVNFKGSWSNLTGALNVPALVFHVGVYWQLINDLADVTASEPGVTGDWVRTTGIADSVPIYASGNLDYPGKYLLSGSALTMVLPDPAGMPDGVSYILAKDSGFNMTIQTVTDGFSTRAGLTDEIIMDVSSGEFVVNNGKYEVV